MKTDVRIVEVEPRFEQEAFRTPLVFGSGVVRTATSLTVRVRVENGLGRTADGWGNILLAYTWAFPSDRLTPEARDAAMRDVAAAFCAKAAACTIQAHPIELFLELKPELAVIADQVSQRRDLPQKIPALAALVCASPVDAAVHDAFGHVNRICSYDGCGREFMARDLGAYLGPAFDGRYPADYLRRDYAPELPVFHLVGGVDKLTRAELSPGDPRDGLPNCLEDWIERDGVFCFKIKLRGHDLAWDVERVKQVVEVLRARQVGDFFLSADTNEMCDSPRYCVDLLERLKAECPVGFERLLYLEQPTERDLTAHEFDMRALAGIKPVLVDEGVTTFDDLDLAQRLGWSGIALKTCKGHSASLLYIAKAAEARMLYTVQDLTNPGLALVHSVGLAARSFPLRGVEYNARQYIPWAAQKVQAAHDTLFHVRAGRINTERLSPFGLGYAAAALR
jgi:L-alanine-DL-glutamate epimerase-like enolase superfamily enzyme